MKKPKDLGIKIGSKTEVMWTGVRDSCQQNMESLSKEIIIAKAMLDLANAKIQREQDKQKGLNISKP